MIFLEPAQLYRCPTQSQRAKNQKSLKSTIRYFHGAITVIWRDVSTNFCYSDDSKTCICVCAINAMSIVLQNVSELENFWISLTTNLMCVNSLHLCFLVILHVFHSPEQQSSFSSSYKWRSGISRLSWESDHLSRNLVK